MSTKFARNALAAAIATVTLTVGWAGSATAATAPLSHARITQHFDPDDKQMPENIVLEPDGGIDLSSPPQARSPGSPATAGCGCWRPCPCRPTTA